MDRPFAMMPCLSSALRLAGAVLFAAMILPSTTFAGTLYRCEGAGGVSHYGSRKLPGMTCTVAARYRPDPRPAIPRAPAPAPTAASDGAPATPSAPVPKRVEFLALPGDSSAPAAAAPRGSRVTRGAVYTYEKDGVTHYTNVRPRDAGAPVRTLFTYVETCYACAALPGIDFGNVRLNMLAFESEIRAAASEFRIDEALVRAIVHAESAFNPNAVSHKGAQGLMQLIPATAERFGVADAFDPVQNIRGGAEYLAWLLDRFDGNVTLAAAGYNAGEGNVDRYGGVPPFDETQRYVQRVATLHARYREALATSGGSPVRSGASGISGAAP